MIGLGKCSKFQGGKGVVFAELVCMVVVVVAVAVAVAVVAVVVAAGLL